MTIDFAYKANNGNDYILAVGDSWQSCLYIVDCIRERWKADEISICIVNAIRDYPEKVGIEEVTVPNGCSGNGRRSRTQGLVLPQIEWISLGQGRTPSLSASSDSLHGSGPAHQFLDNIQCGMDELCTEFVGFKAKSGYKDIPDAISRLLTYELEATMPDSKEERIAAWQRLRNSQSNQIYGEGKYAHIRPASPDPIPEPDQDVDPSRYSPQLRITTTISLRRRLMALIQPTTQTYPKTYPYPSLMRAGKRRDRSCHRPRRL